MSSEVGKGVAEAAAKPPVKKSAEGEILWRSEQLFGNQRRLVIHHDGADYRLQITGNGKLLLTK